MKLIDAFNQQWLDTVSLGYCQAQEGKAWAAFKTYQDAEEMAVQSGLSIRINPRLSLLRHYEGTAEGVTVPFDPTEDQVVAITWGDGVEESEEIDKDMTTLGPVSIQAIENMLSMGVETHHVNNIKQHLPHLMVLSPGRSGTISLYKLLQKTHYLPYHQPLFNVPRDLYYMQHALLREPDIPYSLMGAGHEWIKSRAAEWLGAINLNRPMALCLHLDTIFAPVFAALHPLSKFIYLKRHSADVAKSFISKNQWHRTQITNITYGFDPWRWRRIDEEENQRMARYLHYNLDFWKVFQETMRHRAIEISADKLFAQDPAEVKRLIEFTEIDMTVDEVAEHYKTPTNQKLHKVIHEAM